MGDLLFLAHRVPYPPDRGDKIRSFHILKHLAGRHRVHLATFADDEADMAAAEALRPMLGEMHVERTPASRLKAGLRGLATRRALSVAALSSPTMAAFVDRLLIERPVDRLYVFSGQMGQYAPTDRPFVMDFVDMDSEKFAAYGTRGRGPMRWVWRREARRLFHFERELAGRAVVSLFVSEPEAALFRARTGLSADAVQAVENGIDFTAFAPQPHIRDGAPLILFTGQMNYAPNIEAVCAFARETMPLVRARHAQARFAIVGRKPDAAVRALDGVNGTEVVGEVPDMRPWFARADVVVAPLRLARGVQNKVLEAMAMARPVVASPAAFEGLDAEPGLDLIVAEGAEAEADAVCAVLDDPQGAARIAAAARDRIERHYDWNARLAPLDAMMARL